MLCHAKPPQLRLAVQDRIVSQLADPAVSCKIFTTAGSTVSAQRIIAGANVLETRLRDATSWSGVRQCPQLLSGSATVR